LNCRVSDDAVAQIAESFQPETGLQVRFYVCPGERRNKRSTGTAATVIERIAVPSNAEPSAFATTPPV
jgi:hypothetical protein